ncbi:Hsp70 family protein [Deltaproteobacteria bacterium TL4]
MQQIKSRYLIGIDLGTSNCSVFYSDQEDLTRRLHHFFISQWISEEQIHDRPLLPSVLYMPTAHETQGERGSAPWNEQSVVVVGEWAKQQLTKHPERSIHSAKSWLCYHGIDPHLKFLPQSEADLPRWSPVEVTTALLNHIKETWNFRFAKENPALKMEAQSLVVTVPASFDEVALELTDYAIKQAGFQKYSLLEEPQAAFYSWLVDHYQEEPFKEQNEKHLTLVIDIGGGTSDFSLMRTFFKAEQPTPTFERVAVSDHLLLGGDNMDLAIAAHLEAQFSKGQKRLVLQLWDALVQQCRRGKEQLFSGDHREVIITIARAGSSLLGNTQSTKLSVETLSSLLIEGFLPKIPWNAPPPSHSTQGLRQIGLPYAQEPAITRHIGAFLKNYLKINPQAFFPDQLLFNGGVLLAEPIRTRLLEQLEEWRHEAMAQGLKAKEQPMVVLASLDLHLAVARGAAYYQLARQGSGWLIEGGSARSYYINLHLETQGTDSGKEAWLCVLPQHATPQTLIPVSTITFLLRINQPIQFRMISSIHRPEDQPGTLFEFSSQKLKDQFIQLPPIQTLITPDRALIRKKTKEIEIHLRAQLNEIGTLNLYCVDPDHQLEWKLEFRIREETDQPSLSLQQTMPGAQELFPGLEQASELLKQWLRKGKSGQPQQSTEVSVTYRALENCLNLPRKEWSPLVLRQLWEALHEGLTRRNRSVQHELNWYKFAGFFLRPGLGVPGDELRMQQLSEVFTSGIHFRNEKSVEIEWWVMCRRVAAGITPQHQELLLKLILNKLNEIKTQNKRKTTGVPKTKKGSKALFSPSALNELWRLAASLEHISANHKEVLGNELLQQAKTEALTGIEGWCLARLGARIPVYGNTLNVVSPKGVEPWVEWLIKNEKALPFKADLPLILTRMTQMTGNRSKDVHLALRHQVLTFLKTQPETTALIQLLEEPQSDQGAYSAESNEWFLGDSLPAGLKLLSKDGLNSIID